MKIAIVGPFQEGEVRGGVENHVHHLSLALENEGIEVERWSWKKNCGRKVRPFSLSGLHQVYAKTDADIVHLHSTAIAAATLANVRKKTTAATIHAFYHPEYEEGLGRKAMTVALAPFYETALKRIGNNIAVSNFVKKEADGKHVPVAAVIGNGIELSELDEIRAASEFKSDVVFSGRLVKQKGVDDFIKAVEGTGLKAVLVGYGNHKAEEQVRKHCEKAGIRCLIRPSREKMLSVIKASKIFVFPSRCETFGISAMEAMALGKSVLTYREAEGPLDFVEDGENGMIVAANFDKLRKAMKQMVTSDKLDKMNRNATATAKEYDWAKVAEKTIKLYEKINEGK
jgi:glycosyltransferase involved in cell wall biosynthesis